MGAILARLCSYGKHAPRGRTSLSACDAALLPTQAIGADGVLLGIAGFLPDLVIGLFNAARNGDYEKARMFADKLEPMSHYLYGVPPRSLRHIRTKAALKRLGIISSDMVSGFQAKKRRLFVILGDSPDWPELAIGGIICIEEIANGAGAKCQVPK